jgi:N-methylhydantoinase A
MNCGFEVDEKTKRSGEIAKTIDEQEILKIVDRLKRERIEAVAVCFINSYANPENEKAADRDSGKTSWTSWRDS